MSHSMLLLYNVQVQFQVQSQEQFVCVRTKGYLYSTLTSAHLQLHFPSLVQLQVQCALVSALVTVLKNNI